MTVFNGSVAESAGDATEASGTINTTETSRICGQYRWIGWIIPNVTIPQGAAVSLAELTWYWGSFPGFSGYNPHHQFWCSKGGAEDFVDDPEIANRQVRGDMILTPSVTLNVSLGFSASPGDPYTLDITTIVQAAVNHGDWDSGDSLGIYCVGLGAGRYLSARFYDYAPAGTYAAELAVTYTGDVEFTGSTGSIALAGEAGSWDILPPPIDIDDATTGSIALTGNRNDPLTVEILADSPRGYWPLNEASGTTVNDYSGLSHPGTYVNSPNLGADGLVPTSPARSADFEATNSHHVTVADHADFDTGDVFSLECVFRPEAFGANQALFDKGTGSYNLTITTTRFLQLQKRGTGVICNSTIQLNADQTYHIIATKDGSTVKLWIDGVDRTGTVSNQTITDTTTAVHLCRASGSSNYGDGRMQDAAVYGTALDSSRVAAHYEAYSEGLAIITTFIEADGSTGSIALTGQQGSYDIFLPDDDLTYGGTGVYGGNGLYDGPALDHPPSQGRIRVDLYDPFGNKLATPPLTAVIASYAQSINETGDFRISTPAAAVTGHLDVNHPSGESTGFVTPGQRIRLYVEGEGEVFRGIIREVTMEDSADGDPLVVIEGPGLGDDLISANMLLGRLYIDQTPTAMLADMLSIVDGWSSGVVSSPTSPATSSVSAEADTVLGAIRQMCERFHYHARVNTLTQTVDVGPMGLASGLRLLQLPYFDPRHDMNYPNVVAIASITLMEQGHDVWNSILPHGSGEGVAALTLEHSTRTEPYEILSTLAPDGRALFYIEDADSIAIYGRRQRVVIDKHVVPQEISQEALEAAADALYDGAVTYLSGSKDHTHTYRITTAPFRHVVDGVEQFRVGDTVNVRFRGRAEKTDGSGYVYLEINQDLYVSGYSRTLSADGIKWDLDVQDVLGKRVDPAARMAEAIEQIWAVMVQPKLADINPPAHGEPEASSTRYTVNIDTRRIFWVTKADIIFTVAGAGAWTGGTISINGVDVTADLDGPWTRGVEYTVDVRPFLERFQQNVIEFEAGTAFTITVDKDTRGIGSQNAIPSGLFGP